MQPYLTAMDLAKPGTESTTVYAVWCWSASKRAYECVATGNDPVLLAKQYGIKTSVVVLSREDN